jgi:putative pyruvate formate lyase activating enzyme
MQRRRLLHLAPPFLLDDYIPRYQLLSEIDASKKRSLAYAHLRNCNLCPRLCGVNRFEATGMCLIGDNVKVNVIAPHFGEGGLYHSMFPLSLSFNLICLFHVLI